MTGELHLEQFPCFYTFKIFGRHDPVFVERVRTIIGDHLGVVPLDSIKVRASARGRYLSVTLCTRVESRALLERVYTDLHAEPTVLLYI